MNKNTILRLLLILGYKYNIAVQMVDLYYNNTEIDDLEVLVCSQLQLK